MRADRKSKDSLGENCRGLNDLVYQRLRHEMLWGSIKPGSVLSVRKLAGEFGVSTMPVRDALRRLAIEGMVNATPRSSTRVAETSIESIREIYEVRGRLEPLAARLAVGHLTPVDIRFLRRCDDKQESAASANRLLEWHRWNRDFHFLIFRRCGNGLLQRMCQDTLDRNFRLFSARALAEPGFCDRRVEEHKRILRAIERGSPDAIEAAWREHVVQSGMETLAGLRDLYPETEKSTRPTRRKRRNEQAQGR